MLPPSLFIKSPFLASKYVFPPLYIFPLFSIFFAVIDKRFVALISFVFLKSACVAIDNILALILCPSVIFSFDIKLNVFFLSTLLFIIIFLAFNVVA